MLKSIKKKKPRNLNPMSKTIFCDIDGTILYQNENFLDWYLPFKIGGFGVGTYKSVLDKAQEKLLEWHSKGYRIILTTGRPENDREKLSKYLSDMGIYFHQLVMDCGSGERVLINDIDTDAAELKYKATAINVVRNKGIGDLEL